MPLDSSYVLMTGMDDYFVDKDTGLPLTAGVLSFFRDNNRSQTKEVYMISGTPPNYSYTDIGSTVTLNAVGNPQYESTNIAIYGFPFDEDGNLDLYYVTCKSSAEVEQFTREGWPNTEGTVSGNQDDNITNYIPNGQFLDHNNIPANVLLNTPAGQISAPVTNIAPGGWYFERPVGSTATDNVTFFRFGSYVANPTGSPRYGCVVQCIGADVTNTFKYLGVRFNDVNKFSSDTNQFTFAFNAYTIDSANFTVGLSIIKYFGTGGTPSSTQTIPVTTFTITNVDQIFQIAFDFGDNLSTQVGNNNDDYVELVLSFPTNISYAGLFADVGLYSGNIDIVNFPTTTDRDFNARTLVPPIIDPDGFTLGLPIIQTKDGLGYDFTQTGKIFPTMYATAGFGELLCDGSQYFTAGYSSDGIPYARLGSILFSSVLQGPIFGSGSNFVKASGHNNGYVTIYTNSAGPQTDTADGANPTGFTFFSMSPGSPTTAGYGFTAAMTVGGTTPYTWAICNTQGITFGVNTNGTTSATVTAANNQSDGSRQANGPNDTQIVKIIAPSTPGAGQYLQITNTTTQYYVWYQINGVGADPAPGGTGIKVNFPTGFNNVTETNVINSAALNGYKMSYIAMTSGSSIPPNSYFTFFSNSQKYYVWYSLNGSGTDPMVSGGIGIPVSYSTSSTQVQITNATRIAINGTYFAVPDLRGMYLKGWDPNAVNDLNSALRYSYGSAQDISSTLGTYQFDTILSHEHETNRFSIAGSFFQSGTTISDNTTLIGTYASTTDTGTPQNDVKNVYVNYVIKY